MSGMDWRCKEIPKDANPDVLFPNNCKPDFDDSDWSGASVRVSGTMIDLNVIGPDTCIGKRIRNYMIDLNMIGPGHQ